MKKVIIIGAGIIGATTAYKLAKKGADVTVIDWKEPGRATDVAAGIISPWLAQRRNKAWYHLAKNGARIYPELITELIKDGETETGYNRIGALSLHTDQQRLLKTQKRVLKRREDAPEIGDVTLLSKSETDELFPFADSKFESLHISGAARVDGFLLKKALLRAAKKHGATMVDGDARLLVEEKTIAGVKVNRNILLADTIIATNGAWMKQLLAPLHIHLDIFPQKGQVIHLNIPNKQVNTNQWPVIMPPNNQYMLPFNNNRIIIGATRERKAKFDLRVTAGGMNEVLSKALEIAPQLADSTVVETKVGFRPFTPGSLPIIGSIPKYKGIILANGLGASGLTTGPFIGYQLAKLVLGEKIDLDLNHYAVSSALK